MIILEDNYPVICRRDSPEKAFSRSRLAASLCEQGQWSRERRQAGMQRGAGGPSPEWPGSLGDLRHPGLCCLHNTHTHTEASESYALFFFFLSLCLQLVYLISVCLGCLLLWASCHDQNLIISSDVVVLYIGKGQWSIAAGSYNTGQLTKAPITSLQCIWIDSVRGLNITLLVMGMDFFNSYSLCCWWACTVVHLCVSV